MAKRRKKKKNSKCPEPFNTLIDIAGGIAMGAIADHMEKKYHYSKKGKINPYAVLAIGIASGRMKTTKDILRTGAILGAMGSFDVDTSDPDAPHSYILDDPIFYDIPEAKVNDNRYAWRLNCADGSEYGVYPEDYETREEYHEAIHHEKYAWRDWCEDGADFGVDSDNYETEEDYEEALEEAKQTADETEDEDVLSLEVDDFSGNGDTDVIEDMSGSTVAHSVEDTAFDGGIQINCGDQFLDDDFHVFIYCKVGTETGVDYFRTEDRSIKRGDNVVVPTVKGTVIGEVISVEHHMRFSAPKPVDVTRNIIGKKR